MSDRSSIFFMLGRFQPFTLGHMALLNQMLEEASKKSDSKAYLFVSHKKAAGSRSGVAELERKIKAKSDMRVIKGLMKTSGSIMDYPLHATQRVNLVLTLLSKIYDDREIRMSSKGEAVILVNSVFDLEERTKRELPNSVELHIIDCSKVEGTAGYKAHSWLKSKYEGKKAHMVTGSNRDLSHQYKILANNPVFVERNETNSTDDNHYTKLSGSKIRSWSVMLTQPGNEENIAKIKDAYYSLLTEEELLDLIVNPINESIFSGPSRPAPSSSSRRTPGSVRPLSKNTRKKESSVSIRSKRKASSPAKLNTNNGRRRSSRVRTKVKT